MEFITRPEEIEKKSFEMIAEIIGDRPLDARQEKVIKRVIHTSADFDYLDNLVFSKDVVEIAQNALRRGADIVTDTQMARSGINKKALGELGCAVHCFIDSDEVAQIAGEKGLTRARVAVDYAFEHLTRPLIFVVGNAPTALIRLHEIITTGAYDKKPELIVAVPVGFVNVVESKELILTLDVPHIVAKGRKGGSNIAAAICNALMYEIVERKG